MHQDEQTNFATCPCCAAPVSPLDLLTDADSGTVTFAGKSARMQPSPFKLLMALIDAYPNALTKEQCLRALTIDNGSRSEETEMKVVDVQVCKMRKQTDKLGLVITTLWGVGYRLELCDELKAEVTRSLRFKQTRNSRGAITQSDITTVRMLRDQGYPLTDIARRLKLTFKAVSSALDAIKREDDTMRDRTRFHSSTAA